jgi:hypothetical protein
MIPPHKLGTTRQVESTALGSDQDTAARSSPKSDDYWDSDEISGDLHSLSDILHKRPKSVRRQFKIEGFDRR